MANRIYSLLIIVALASCKTPKPAPAETLQSVPPPAVYADWIEAQRKAVEKDPQNPRELKRLVAMLLADGHMGEVEKLIESLPRDAFSDGIKLMLAELSASPAYRDILQRRLAAVEPPKKIHIARAELCRKISGYRRYVPYGEPKFKAGSMALVYVEFEGYELAPWGDYLTLHLRYEWELYDAQDRKLSIPAWDKAAPQEKEDKIEFRGPVADFHQTFGLPLPKNLPGGQYSLRIIVEDRANKKRDEVRLPIEVLFD